MINKLAETCDPTEKRPKARANQNVAWVCPAGAAEARMVGWYYVLILNLLWYTVWESKYQYLIPYWLILSHLDDDSSDFIRSSISISIDYWLLILDSWYSTCQSESYTATHTLARTWCHMSTLVIPLNPYIPVYFLYKIILELPSIKLHGSGHLNPYSLFCIALLYILMGVQRQIDTLSQRRVYSSASWCTAALFLTP